MRVPLFQIDAFTSELFAGNPAAVVVFERYPEDRVLQAIAAENNLPETAFLEPAGEHWNLCWFTPTVEVPLCGHATLASAWVVLERLQPASPEVTFLTRHRGRLVVRRTTGGYVMDFPARPCKTTSLPAQVTSALGATPVEFLASEDNYLAVMESARVVRGLAPDLEAIRRLDRPGLIVTAPGDNGFDCVSRYFAPAKGIPEDPVTGGAHCALTPYWTTRLGKPELFAFQASRRGGSMRCRINGERVELEGSCAPFLEGTIELP
jgi:PhzF family phenazine biosynthesis protein